MIVVVSLGALGPVLCASASATDETRQEQLRRLERRDDPRCASEGPGFFYEESTRSCIRIGGAVGVEFGRGGPTNLMGR